MQFLVIKVGEGGFATVDLGIAEISFEKLLPPISLTTLIL